MKKKFILPAAFALTLHAFLLFGLTDKPAPAAVASGDPQPKDKRDLLPVDADNADTENPGDGDESHSGRQAKTTPRSWDMTPIDPPPGAPIVPRLPPVPGDGSANVIPTDWQLPGGPGGGPHTTVCNLKDLDCLTRARSQPAPIYPADLLGQGIEGTVVVEFIVDLEGNAHSASVVSATHSGFSDAALGAVGRWKFEPGRKTGRKVRFRMSVPVVFRIDGR